MQIGTDRPVFGDRDQTIHDQVQDLSIERQYGYNWFGNTPAEMLETYATWSAAHPALSFRAQRGTSAAATEEVPHFVRNDR